MVGVVGTPRSQSHQRHRWFLWFFTSHGSLFTVVWIVFFALVFLWQRNSAEGVQIFRWNRWRGTPPLVKGVGAVADEIAPLAEMPPPVAQPAEILPPAVFDLREFGGVGDGVVVNTGAFERAVAEIKRRGGGRLNVPSGKWLTAPFNLTSDMTLFLEEGATILGIQDDRYWPLLPALPSYGYGREHKGARYGSLIHGQHLRNVIITGNNGTIDGQGSTWWKRHLEKDLNHTRGPLVQIMWSRDVIISNLTLRNSPFWTLHPYDCKNVTISNLTILAPVRKAPNTDGIDPDSCEDMVIENCYISVGDDGIAIKSGWDQFGIAYGRPSRNILIRNVTLRSVVSSGVSIGSEMSGGVSNITMENLHFWDSRRAVRIKTAPGRGGYVRDITCRNLTLYDLRVGLVIITNYNEHADQNFDPKAVPVIENITFDGVHGTRLRVPVRIQGRKDIPVKGVTFRDVSMKLFNNNKKDTFFQCAYVQGRVIGNIFPPPCKNLDLYDRRGRPLKISSGWQSFTNIDYSI